MSIIRVRGIYTINVAPDKRYCGYCTYCECLNLFQASLFNNSYKYKCFLFKETLNKDRKDNINRCKKCLKGEIK